MKQAIKMILAFALLLRILYFYTVTFCQGPPCALQYVSVLPEDAAV